MGKAAIMLFQTKEQFGDSLASRKVDLGKYLALKQWYIKESAS